jgi:RNA-binding protein 25
VRSPGKRAASKSPLRARDTNGAQRHADETEEEYELRKLDRKLREKELAYRERLREWELREAKRARLYADEKRDELSRRKSLAKEGKKLKQFLEDYDDEKDDSNFYKGASLAKKLKLREREIELDNRDRMREKDEIDELKRKLIKQGHEADVDEQLRKVIIAARTQLFSFLRFIFF